MKWSSEIEDVDEVTRQLKVCIPASAYKGEYDTALDQVMRSVRLKGFRPGKAPRQLVDKLHGKRVQGEVASKLISDSLKELIVEHKLSLVGEPEIDITSMDLEQELKYHAVLSILPQPTISGYESFEVVIPETKVTDKDVDQVIEQLRDRKATTRPNQFRTTAQVGDVVAGDLRVWLDGEARPDRAEPLTLELGKGQVAPELEDGILGMEIGQNKEISGVIPDDHPNEKLRGQHVIYSVTLNGISDRILPEIDDEFVKSLDGEAQTLLELRMKIRESLEEGRKKEEQELIRMKALEALIAANSFKIPQALIDDEIRAMLVAQGILDPKKHDVERMPVASLRERFGESAERRVRSRIIIDCVGRQESISLGENDLEQAFADLAEGTGIPIDQVMSFYAREDERKGFEMELVRNKVLSFLQARSTVEFSSTITEAP